MRKYFLCNVLTRKIIIEHQNDFLQFCIDGIFRFHRSLTVFLLYSIVRNIIHCELKFILSCIRDAGLKQKEAIIVDGVAH